MQVMASHSYRHRERPSLSSLILPAVLALLFGSACEVSEVPDGGDCVLAPPLTCNKLTPLQLGTRPRVLFDTDAQFRGDPTTSRRREQGAFGDTSALVYMLLRSDELQLLGVTTTNANDGSIDAQISEVERVAALSGAPGLPVRRGAVGTYRELEAELDEASFDGKEAVDFIITKATIATPVDPLVIILGGKATNLALALRKEPSIAPNIVVHWLATDEPGAAEQPEFPMSARPGGSGMYSILKDPDAANYLLGAPIELYLMRGWSIISTPATEPRYSGSVAGMRIKQAADLPCVGPRVEPVSFPDGSELWTVGSYVKTSFTTFGGNGVRSLDEACLAVLLVRPELAKTHAINAPYYDTVREELIYPESDAHRVFVYDEIETQAVSEEFVDALFDPFLSCEWQ
jgi:inosine-uridine nucleoside N-ribohydrolase